MARNVHGSHGAFVGGDWSEIEECVSKFNSRKESSCGGDCTTCPRSRTKTSAQNPDGSYDVVIIGAGCVGCAIARELSKTTASVLVLEAADDVSQGATKGNSGIVHAGYDDKPGTNRAKHCWPGNQMFSALDKDLHFGFQRNGSLVIARTPEDRDHLFELLARGQQNGVQNLRVVEKDELFEMEPHVHPESIAALYSPDAGNIIPYEYTIALAENAVENGVEIRIRREVVAISIEEDGEMFCLHARHWEPKSYKTLMMQSRAPDPSVAKAKEESKASARRENAVLFAISSVAVAVAIKINVPRIAILLRLPAETANTFCYSAIVVIWGLLYFAFYGLVWLAPSNASESSTKQPLEFHANQAPGPVGSGGTAITPEEMMVGGSGSCSAMKGDTVEIEAIRARFVVNCAGSASDKVAAMIGDKSFKIKPRLGDYILLHKDQGHLAKSTIFPCPGPLGKGVLVQSTLWGNLILGPTARDIHLPEVMSQTPEDIQSFIFSKCKEIVPGFDPRQAIHAFSGLRAKSDRGDWIIESSKVHPRFVLAAGIDSPGLAGSPSIALEVVRLLRDAGFSAGIDGNFNPVRHPVIVPKAGWKGISAGPLGKFTDPKKNVICKCEKVTEDEVLTALYGPLPVDSTQAIRKRTRAGMGHCQGDEGNYDCERRVAGIIARELGLPVQEIGRRPWPATSTLPQRWITDEHREALAKLADASD